MKTLRDRLAGGISPDDMKTIEKISRDEIVRAFRQYPISIVGRTAGLYHVRVVDSLNSAGGGSAESDVFPGLGGQGFINFRNLAHGAIAYAPADADRQEIVAAIGRGIGRTAVHEFTHQLLGRHARIDDFKGHAELRTRLRESARTVTARCAGYRSADAEAEIRIDSCRSAEGGTTDVRRRPT